MSTLWHFGSESSIMSYGKELSKYRNKSYNLSISENKTNHSIFKNILQNTHLFQSNDEILVNWTDFKNIDIVIKKNGKAKSTDLKSRNYYEIHSDYYNHSNDKKKFFHQESFLLFTMILEYHKSLEEKNINVYFLYDTDRSILIPPRFDLLYSITGIISQTSFISFLLNTCSFFRKDIESEENRLIARILNNYMNQYKTNYSETIDNSEFPKSRWSFPKNLK